ncbi:amino acid permease [Mycoplasmopsis gallopavonis]|uniref:Uncharacterized protein n=1 Tax=Mycoplasmopsis gallopavonis TaxID=76629 RepID=A0A449AZ76_9BACT|nr:amino acid permease [Mycoplasmopsis gallopavonis]RIV16811.1 amino acid permease [Mycoplasmopsis gallopavonis]VEU72823.1 Uncharacterised protein [Mycoplasmopsis gallopavonis]
MSNALLFVYAFAGTEDVSAMVKDVKFKSFRKILLIAFAFVLVFYFIVYTLLLNFAIVKTEKGLIAVYSVFGIIGTILFILGYLSNDVGSKVTLSIATARKLVPIAEDGHLFSFLTKRNRRGEFSNAIWFTTIITLITMVIFWIMNIFLGSSKPDEQDKFFETAIIANGIALLVEDICTFIVALILDRKKIITKIPLWEKLYYLFDIVLIITLILSFFFPQIYGEPAETSNYVVIVIYFGFLILGVLFKTISFLNKK